MESDNYALNAVQNNPNIPGTLAFITTRRKEGITHADSHYVNGAGELCIELYSCDVSGISQNINALCMLTISRINDDIILSNIPFAIRLHKTNLMNNFSCAILNYKGIGNGIYKFTDNGITYRFRMSKKTVGESNNGLIQVVATITTLGGDINTLFSNYEFNVLALSINRVN